VGTTYQVCIFTNGIQFRCANYLITATLYPSGFNLNTAQPILPTQASPTQVTGARSFTFNQSTPATTWTITHNFNDPNPQVQCFDSSGNIIFPDKITYTSANVVTALFVSAQSGGCRVISAGYLNIVSNLPNAIVSNPAGAQTINGPLTIGGPLTFTTPLTANNLSGPGSVTGTYTHNGPETFLSTLNCTIVNAVRCVSPLNPQLWSGSTPDAWISSAISSIGVSGGELFIGAGTYNPVAQVAISTPVWMHGSGINATILKPTNALAAVLFSVTTSVEGMKFSDMTIDMTNAPTIGVFNFSGGLRPILENVRILYPATTGTGTAILTANAENHFRNVNIKGAGICVDVNGNTSAENFYDDIVCEDPGSFGYRRLQTTSTDVGGEYLTHFKVTNPDNRTGAQAFLVSSSAANTGSPFFCVQCVGDNTQGGHTYQIHNMVNVFLDGVWATNTATLGSNFSAVNIDNSTNVFVRGGYFASLSKDVILSGTDTTIKLDSNFFGGTVTNISATGSTLSGVRLVDPIFTAATPVSSTDLSSIVASGSSQISTNGWHVAVSGTGSGPQTLDLFDTDATDTLPHKYLRTAGTSGSFQILNNALAQILAVNDAGTVATLGANRVLFHGFQGSCAMAAASTCTFSIPASFSSTPLTYVSIDAASTVPATANSAKCSVSGTTVTVTAGASNSLTWDCLLVGAPD
jgi:hypothetical protein